MKVKLGDLYIGNFPTTQVFGVNPSIYKQFGLNGHNGWDIGTPNGTPLIAPADGEVIRSQAEKDANGKYTGYGEYIQLLHWLKDPFDLWNEKIYGFSTLFAHQKERKVNTGDKVVKGQLLGYSDNTGFSTGPHLHFGFCYVDKEGYRLFKENGFKGWQDPLDKQLVEWVITNPTEPILPPKDDALTICLKQHADLVDRLNFSTAVRESISKTLFGNKEATWEKIKDDLPKIIDEADDNRGLAGLGKELWDEVVKEVGGKYIYPEDIGRLSRALHELTVVPPEGKVLIDSKELEDLKEKAKKPLSKYTGLELIIEGLKRLIVWNKGGEKNG